MNPWLGVLLLLGAMGGLIAGLRTLQTRFDPHPELVRKLLHVVMGLVALSLPWLFDAAWPVLLVAGLAFAGLLLLGWSRLRRSVGQVIRGVGRRTQGELLFPLAVATVFVLSEGDPVLFGIPMLVLTLADAGAALVGLRYGLARFSPRPDAKSVEGSVAFFVVTFVSVLLVLLLLTDTGRLHSVLVALLLALLVMLLEAMAWSGLDNLLIPLGGFLLLRTYLTMDAADLLINLSVVAVFIAFVAAWRRRTRMDLGGVVGAALTGYVIWSTAGWLWMLAPLILFVSFAAFLPRSPTGRPTTHQTAESVVSATAPGLLWLLVAESLGKPALIFPYTLTFAVTLAIIGVSRVREPSGRGVDRALVVQSIIVSWVLLFVPFLVLDGVTWINMLLVGAALGIVAIAAAIFYYVQPSLVDQRNPAPRWLWQSGIALATSCLGLAAVVWFV